MHARAFNVVSFPLLRSRPSPCPLPEGEGFYCDAAICRVPCGHHCPPSISLPVRTPHPTRSGAMLFRRSRLSMRLHVRYWSRVARRDIACDAAVVPHPALSRRERGFFTKLLQHPADEALQVLAFEAGDACRVIRRGAALLEHLNLAP